MCKDLSPMVCIFVCVEKKHTDKQRNKHTYETKEKEKQTETETEIETISIYLVGPIQVQIHFQGETKKQNTKDKR